MHEGTTNVDIELHNPELFQYQPHGHFEAAIEFLIAGLLATQLFSSFWLAV